ncbi:hypothetical protein [Paenibacillus sp. GXUN7292]|uniref:hypothetical protein n=1 Tax=Paenibacillus sp. GXUN7292 TaxID=3422499 RepID=UPI003D7DB7EB
MNKDNQICSKEDVCRILKISESKLKSLISTGQVRVNGNDKLSIYKSDVDKLVEFIESTYGFQEVVQLVRKEEQLADISQHSVMNYMKKFEIFPNPLHGKDTRLRKEDFDELCNLLLNNFKSKVTKKKLSQQGETQRGRRSKFQQRIDKHKGQILYLSDADKNNVFDFSFLEEYTKERTPTLMRSLDSLLRYMIGVCKEQEIQWLTNKSHSEIYIQKDDFKKYEKHFENVRVFNPDDYYTTQNIKDMFRITNYESIAKYAGSITVSGKVYIEKTKVDVLKKILDETVVTADIQEMFDIPTTTFARLMKSLDIQFIPQGAYPLFQSSRVYKSELIKFEEYFQNKNKLTNITSRYDQFYIEVEEIRPNVKVIKTLEAFDSFIQKRLDANGHKYVYTNLVNVYGAIIPTLTKEIMSYTMDELIILMKNIPQKVAKREFSFFLDYCRERYPTTYKESFKLDGESEEQTNEAYTLHQWLDFAYLLFTEHEKLLPKAIENRINAMVWLYCAMHYVCGWRQEDILNLPEPSLKDILGLDEDETFDLISQGKFTEEMAQRIVNFTISYIKTFGVKPKKTRKNMTTPDLKIVIEESYIYTIGLLIALCQSHRKKMEKLNYRNVNTSTLMTARITKRDTHVVFFGEEYENIFGEETFLNNRATKTYMNYAQIVSSENKWGNGYNISSFIRSHAISKKNGFARTTEVYLESINKDNDVGNITHALTERGSFGFISHLLAQVIRDGDDEAVPYALLSWEEQTAIIKDFFGLKSFQIDTMVRGIGQYQNRATEVMRELMVAHKDGIKEVLKKLSVGDYPSKMEYSQCLLKTINRSSCAYPVREHCIGCEYALNEMYFLIEFNKRFKELLLQLKQAEHEFDKQRFTYTLFYVYLPVLQEAVNYFGKERVRAFVKVPGEEIKQLQKENQLQLGGG